MYKYLKLATSYTEFFIFSMISPNYVPGHDDVNHSPTSLPAATWLPADIFRHGI